MLSVLNVSAQSSCDSVRLYDQMTLLTDQPILQRLKPFDIRLVPVETLDRIKQATIRHTSAEFASALKIRSVKIFDSLVARAWSWTNPPIRDREGNAVDRFYSILYETLSSNQTPFVFRADFLADGRPLNEDQLGFYNGGPLDIKSCKEIAAIASSDSLHPIRSIEYIALTYNSREMLIVWTVVSKEDPQTGAKYFKEIDAASGYILQRGDYNIQQPLREIKIQSGK